jgi:hypothetical protein
MKLFVKQSIIEKLRTRNQFIREYKKQSQHWRENPDEFVEKILGCELYWYQKIMIKFMNGSKIISIPSKYPIRSKIHIKIR